MNYKLRETFEKNKLSYRKHLENLIAIDTQDIGHGILGGKELEGQKYIEQVFLDMNADEIIKDQMVEEDILKGIELHNEGNPGHNYEDRYNLFAKFKGKGTGKSILFNGHVDTMPPGDLNKWDIDPWTPTYKDNLLYGLGATDMKAGLMASIMAMKLIKDAGIELDGDVLLSSVVDEEGGGNGSISAVINDRVADAAVICEPSESEIIIAHMGFVFFDVKVEGKALHSGYKWKGVNAIEKAIILINALNDLEHRWLMNYKHALLPPPTLNVGVIEGGQAGSTVPDECSFKMCIHYLPKVMNHQDVVDEIVETLNIAADGDLWLKEHRPTYEIYQAGGAFEQEVDEFVLSAKESLEKVQDNVKLLGGAAGNDARLYSNIANIPTIIMGPGYSEQCHMPNEFVDIESYDRHILAYAELILKWTKGE